MDMITADDAPPPAVPTTLGNNDSQDKTAPEDASRKAQVLKIIETIKEDRKYFQGPFKQMRRDMFIARNGRLPEYPSTHYKANLAGRHISQKTATLYAKNPKAEARRRETLDFEVWDEDPKSLEVAMQVLQQAQQMLLAAPTTTDPVTGQPVPAAPPPPEAEQAFTKAQQIVADFQQGMEKRTLIKKLGTTLEILFSQAMREQKPVDFKTGMKKLVRRTCTTGVGYLELAFQRETGPRPITIEKLADFQARLDHLKRLSEDVNDQEDPIDPDDPEIFELQEAIAALQAEPEIILREGLIFDFLQSTKVIPDKLTQSLVGFVGARHVTLEYLYTADQVRETFDIDVGKKYQGYKIDGTDGTNDVSSSSNYVPPDNASRDDLDPSFTKTGKGTGLVCVWKHYDKPSGLVYYVADGYDDFLREPASPDVFVEDFWPVYAITFNDVESETELFPPSDVFLMTDQQMEFNRSRQGMKEHRAAARPRFAYANGVIEEEDVKGISQTEPFTAVGINLPPGGKVGDVLQPMPVPGVDPNLYATEQYFTDVQMVVGSSEAQFGGTSSATATESSIAASSSASSAGSNIDDLDAFLTVVARAAGQILLKEMSEEQVKLVAGVGAVWPQMTLGQITDEIFLEVEAGSTGKPNQAVELSNWEKLLPFLIQMPGINPTWLARETLRRLDDKADLTEALTEGVPSIMAQNGLSQISTGNPATDPNAQGGQGAQNAPTETSKVGGSSAPMGNNQV